MFDALEAKALRNPFRFGLMLGALLIPTGWTISQDVWLLISGHRILDSESVTLLFAWGLLPGMILGAGAVRAWAAWRAGDLAEVRILLIGHGMFVAIPCALLLISLFQRMFAAAPTQGGKVLLSQDAFWLYADFPLQFAVAMLLLGLFLRSPRA